MSQDFEDPNFDAIAYLNNRFPDEDSLVQLDDEIAKLNTQLQSVNKQLIDQIHEHAMMNVEIGQEIKKAKTLSKQIITEIGTIKQKAKKSQQIVYDMCKDLKSLDIAKKNLTFSIDALKKFIMMVDAIEKLRESCQHKKYAQVANLLSAFDGLSNHFKKYQQIPQIQQLYKDKNAIVEELYQQIKQDFEAFQNQSSLLTAQNMAAAANVIEILAIKYYRKFIQALNEIFLKQYQQQFGSPENSVLENTERRFGFIKRKMDSFYAKYGKIFPPKWGIDCLIYYQFCSITRLHLTTSLERTFDKVNVAVLMKSLQLSLKFQNKLTQMMKQKYGDQINKKQIKSPCDLQALPKFSGSISNSFEPYLKPYIKSQEDALCDGLQKALDDDRLTEIKVFNSSIVLFHGIKNTIRRASTYSRGNLIIDIVRVVQKMLKVYGDKCFQKTKKVGDNYQANICWVINTAQYCKNIIEGVKQVLEENIDESYTQNIQFTKQQEDFGALISKSIELLISSLQSKLEACFILLTKVQWDQYEGFGEQSRYIKDAKEIIKGTFMKVKDQMNSVYLSLFVDKIVVLVSSKFIQNVLKCKKLPETAFQVFLMDFTELKDTINSIIKTDQQTFSQKAREKELNFVKKTFSKGQNMIKLMSLTNDQFAQKFESMMEGATVVDLEKILQVRGGKKSEFPNLVKALQNKYN